MTTALYQLLSWFSPSFPTGSYAYSHGLENAIQEGPVRDKEELLEWIRGVIRFGDVFQDGIIIKEAHGAFNNIEHLKHIAIFAQASRLSHDKALEDESQANAFAKNILDTDALLPLLDYVERNREWQLSLSYPVVCGIVTAAKGASAFDVVLAYIQSFIAKMVSVAVKSIPLGQSDGLWVLKNAECDMYQDIERILQTPLDESSSANFLLACLRRSVPKLFRLNS